MGNPSPVKKRIAYPPGKLPLEDLSRLLERYAPKDPRLLVTPGIGRDAAVISFGDRYLVAKTDPITFATDQIGWYAVNINANDIAAMGGIPRWFLATLLLPGGKTGPGEVEEIFRQISAACRELGVSLCGGHTEITPTLERPIVVGQMLGEVTPKIAAAIGASPAYKILLPLTQEPLEIVGVSREPLPHLVDMAVLQRLPAVLPVLQASPDAMLTDASADADDP